MVKMNTRIEKLGHKETWHECCQTGLSISKAKFTRILHTIVLGGK